MKMRAGGGFSYFFLHGAWGTAYLDYSVREIQNGGCLCGRLCVWTVLACGGLFLG